MRNYTHKRPRTFVRFVDKSAPPLQKPGQSVCAFGLDFLDFHAKTFGAYTFLKNSI